MDWSAHYDAIYGQIGVDAHLISQSSAAEADLTVIDKTAGIEVLDGAVLTVRPVAFVRMAELTANGLTRDDLNGASLTFNGKSWLVKLHQPHPSPAGEGNGEIKLILSESDA